MSKTEVTNAITIPEDEGTGTSTDSADWISAGHIAGLHAQSNTTDYVENGLSMSVNTSTDSPVVNIGSGLLFLYSDRSVRVQNSSGQYNNDWNHGVTYAIHIGSNEIELTTGVLNHVYIELDLQNNNRCFYTILTGTSPSPPSAPHLRIGLVDLTVGNPSAETVNRLPTHELSQTYVRQPPTEDDHVVRQTDLDSALDSSLPIHDNEHHSPAYATEEALNTHINANNPHSITSSDVGALSTSGGTVSGNIDIEQANLNVSDGNINTNQEVSGNTVTADSAMNIPVYSGSDPDNGNIWIREDL